MALKTNTQVIVLFVPIKKTRIEERIEEFKDFKDLKKRVKLLPDPKKIVVKRILSELKGNEKYNLFVGR